MTEQPSTYTTQADELAEVAEAVEMLGAGYEQPAAIIDHQRNVTALRDGGLIEYKVWGWVKMSSKFISHIRKLKGAKLAVWNVIALTISEDGKCELSVAEIAELAGYSTSETRATISELGEMGYMSVQSKSGKRNIYSPEFVARAAKNPTDRPLQETCTPLVGESKCADDPSSLSIENSTPSIKRVKRVNTQIQGIEASIYAGRPTEESDLPNYLDREQKATDAFERAFGITRPWDWYPAKTSEEKVWKEFRADVLRLYETDPECFTKYVTWMRQPYSKGAKTAIYIKGNPQDFMTIWAGFLASESMNTQAQAQPSYRIGA